MSHIIAQVQEIQSVQNLNILSFTCKDIALKMMSLDLNDTITKDSQVMLTCKPTAIAIGKNIQGELSYANQLHVTIVSLEVGQLLCALKLQFKEFVLESIITTDSQKRMQLQAGDEVTALIKSSDLSIKEVL
ncbi:TOBE domain-containing protein [Sulfurimonas autotrophica]|uniref:TOBE domain protein n=1 Tax=Sulfurimonas autotrophica (strain ATCC BAA-671 / DSM 16294 / JCM 11897 / OK10) TaxID=563040 RepID=E0UR38_SULAO|nr:TOBE domain-containing protein [Sulfurimonas autotrophica]ADN09994.1 TOBE domain protein [Sulfurimonas autotrophica DSM 16294]